MKGTPMATSEKATGPAGTLGRDLENRFKQLAAEWRRDVALLSSVTAIVEHPAYRQIIALGRDVVPLILRELEKEPDH
jgi:hypothetical protein